MRNTVSSFIRRICWYYAAVHAASVGVIRDLVILVCMFGVQAHDEESRLGKRPSLAGTVDRKSCGKTILTLSHQVMFYIVHHFLLFPKRPP